MDRKYKLADETKEVLGVTLHRICALRDFGDVKAGDAGGWVESEENLSHLGACWVYDNAWVFDNARVYGDAQVSGNAWVYDNAWVFDNARVYGDAWVFDNARVSGDARVYDNA